MKNYLLLTVFFLFGTAGFCADPDAVLQNGNKLYQQGKFKEAIGAYEQIISAGKEAPELYFNLGNAYYKNGDNVHAILYYERAAKLAPQDEDIRFNLHMANLKVIDKITPLPEFFINRWWFNVVSFYNETMWARITVVLSFITGLFVIGFIGSRSFASKRILFIGILFSIILLAVTFLAARSAWELQTKNIFALLEVNSTYVKSSPDEKSTDLFILHEGVKMKVVDAIGAWSRVRLADGNEGWVQAKALIVI